MSSTTATQTPTEKKWTPEKYRGYMRERWRRVHNVKPENYKFNKDTNSVSSKYKSLDEYMAVRRQKARERRKPTPKTVCEVCKKEHYDTPGSRLRHEKTVRHKIALELAQAS